MPIAIDTDIAGHIWRLVDGVPAEELVLCGPDDAASHGLTRYGDAYPGERWDTPGAVIRPEHVPRLYFAPAPVVEEPVAEEAPPLSPRVHRQRVQSVPPTIEVPLTPDEAEEHV